MCKRIECHASEVHRRIVAAFVRGLGRPDIVCKDRRNRRALVIETKRATEASQMENICQEALQQIISRGYAVGEDFEGYRSVSCYGVAFYRKSALVRKL